MFVIFGKSRDERQTVRYHFKTLWNSVPSSDSTDWCYSPFFAKITSHNRFEPERKIHVKQTLLMKFSSLIIRKDRRCFVSIGNTLILISNLDREEKLRVNRFSCLQITRLTYPRSSHCPNHEVYPTTSIRFSNYSNWRSLAVHFILRLHNAETSEHSEVKWKTEWGREEKKLCSKSRQGNKPTTSSSL